MNVKDIYEQDPLYWAAQSYEDAIIIEIRLRYTLSEELAIHRQRDTKPAEFAEYNSYCEECKAKVKAIKEYINNKID